ncbi:hypothetical protein AALP_AA4G049800 [Arabis alpina]|uniref:Uncharacterized protein n=1 Tax=Arabis alpina TaxID=50452 RepID=A0A087H186_ARAAL|nr:hypothetical protein AALP_AA4G049800 [Arabis alpina]
MADRSNTIASSPPPSPSVESSPSPYSGNFEITPGPSLETPGNIASPSYSSVLPFTFIVTLFLSLCR